MQAGRAELISRSAMMAPIIAASPSFVPTWQAFVEEWQDDPNGLPYYLVRAGKNHSLAALALHTGFHVTARSRRSQAIALKHHEAGKSRR